MRQCLRNPHDQLLQFGSINLFDRIDVDVLVRQVEYVARGCLVVQLVLAEHIVATHDACVLVLTCGTSLGRLVCGFPHSVCDVGIHIGRDCLDDLKNHSDVIFLVMDDLFEGFGSLLETIHIHEVSPCEGIKDCVITGYSLLFVLYQVYHGFQELVGIVYLGYDQCYILLFRFPLVKVEVGICFVHDFTGIIVQLPFEKYDSALDYVRFYSESAHGVLECVVLPHYRALFIDVLVLVHLYDGIVPLGGFIRFYVIGDRVAGEVHEGQLEPLGRVQPVVTSVGIALVGGAGDGTYGPFQLTRLEVPPSLLVQGFATEEVGVCDDTRTSRACIHAFLDLPCGPDGTVGMVAGDLSSVLYESLSSPDVFMYVGYVPVPVHYLGGNVGLDISG